MESTANKTAAVCSAAKKSDNITELFLKIGYNKDTKTKEVLIMAVTVLNKENFKDEVLNSEKTVLLDFYADWCVPCRRIAPIISEISDERSDIKVCKVNVSEQPELASYFEVTSIPMLAVVKNGKLVKASVGARPKDQILDML